MILFGYPMYGRIEGILEYMEHGKAAGIYTAICTKDWIMRGQADREWLKIKKDNEKYKICRNSDITMYVGLRGFFDIDDGNGLRFFYRKQDRCLQFFRRRDHILIL